MTRFSMVLCAALALVACGGGDGDMTDAGTTTGTDSGTTTGTDSGTTTRRDSGPADMCATDGMGAVALVMFGCNGYASGTAAPNDYLGTCTVGGEGMPQGSCTAAGTFCAADAEGSTTGTCLAPCEAGAGTYISTGGCPMGFRCFDLGDFGLCFRDCDATHPCPTGYDCDGEGSCVGADVPDTDAGTMMMTDGGAAATDGGTPPPPPSKD